MQVHSRRTAHLRRRATPLLTSNAHTHHLINCRRRTADRVHTSTAAGALSTAAAYWYLPPPSHLAPAVQRYVVLNPGSRLITVMLRCVTCLPGIASSSVGVNGLSVVVITIAVIDILAISLTVQLVSQ